MTDFQSYLDKALKKLDINDLNAEDSSNQKFDYDITK